MTYGLLARRRAGSLALAWLAAMVCLVPASAQTLQGVAERLADPRPLVVAHRGCWRQPAENAISAIERCADLGVDMVEIDLRATQDGVIVLLHDASLNRTTNLQGVLRETPYEVVKAARLREGMGGPDAPLTDQHVATFEQVLDAAKGRVLLFLDIKDPIHAQVQQLVRRHGMERQVLYSVNRSFGPSLFAGLPMEQTALMPKFDQYQEGRCLADGDPTPDMARFETLHAPVFEVVFCDDAYLARVRARTGRAGLWVNALGPRFMAGREEGDALSRPDALWGVLLDRGVTAIQTNFPEQLLAYLKRTGRR